MPIYEYHCDACGADHEALQKMSDAPLTDCPACSKPGLRKKVSAAAFRLKGGGWYETDFKTGDKKKNLAGDTASTGSASTAVEEKKPAKAANDSGSKNKTP